MLVSGSQVGAASLYSGKDGSPSPLSLPPPPLFLNPKVDHGKSDEDIARLKLEHAYEKRLQQQAQYEHTKYMNESAEEALPSPLRTGVGPGQ